MYCTRECFFAVIRENGIFKIVAEANKDAQKAFDAKVDAGNTTTPSAPITPVFNDEGKLVSKITVTATKNMEKKTATAVVNGAAASAKITYQWYYRDSKDWKVCGEASAKSATISDDVNLSLPLRSGDYETNSVKSDLQGLS